MATVERREQGSDDRRVRVSSTAANMIASLHPFDETKAHAALTAIRSSVLDPRRVRKIASVDNAFVARAGDLRVVFRNEGDAIVITSVLAEG